MVRKAAIALVAALIMLCGAVAAGLRFNGTRSEPLGFYLAIRKRPEKGDLVFVNPPATPLFLMAKERGYLNVGCSPTAHLIKCLVGRGGDRVTIDSTGVEVNGVRLVNSVPMTQDAVGRPLRYFPLRNYTLGPDEVLLMSDYSSASWDARYFGLLKATTIQSVVTPLLTWR